jgi:hypothetical protein
VQLTIDSNQKLSDVLRVVGALYAVNIGVLEAETTPAEITKPTTPAPRGRKRAPRSRRPAASRGTGRRSSRGTSSAEIRAWAQANGHTVSDRGRIPSAVVTAYHTKD